MTRTAPYDYGCLPKTNTCDDPHTKNGHLRSTPSARPCPTTLYMGPVCPESDTSSTGVRIAINRSVKVVSVAVVVRLDPSVRAANDPWACLRLIDERERDSGTSCEPVPSNGALTMRGSWGPFGTYGYPSARVMVSLMGTGAALVDSISYTVR